MKNEEYEMHLSRAIRAKENELRTNLEALVPSIKNDVSTMHMILRELIDTERAKLGLDKFYGEILLEKNEQKRDKKQPDLIGEGRVAGRKYRAAGWLKGKAIRISLTQDAKPQPEH